MSDADAKLSLVLGHKGKRELNLAEALSLLIERRHGVVREEEALFEIVDGGM